MSFTASLGEAAGKFSRDDILAELDTTQHGATGNAGGREKAIASHHVLDFVFTSRILDTHLKSTFAQLLGINDQPRLHLAANTAQSRGREHAFRRPANAKIDID